MSWATICGVDELVREGSSPVVCDRGIVTSVPLPLYVFYDLIVVFGFVEKLYTALWRTLENAVPKLPDIRRVSQGINCGIVVHDERAYKPVATAETSDVRRSL